MGREAMLRRGRLQMLIWKLLTAIADTDWAALPLISFLLAVTGNGYGKKWEIKARFDLTFTMTIGNLRVRVVGRQARTRPLTLVLLSVAF